MRNLSKTLISSGLLCLFLLLAIPAKTQDYNAWKSAIKVQFPDIPIAAKQKSIVITFEKEKKTGLPYAILKFSYTLINLENGYNREGFNLYYDSNSELSKIKVNNKRFKDLVERLYSNQNIFHSDIKQKSVPINFKRKKSERRLEYKLKINDLRYLGSLFFQENFPIKDFLLQIHVPQWLNLDVEEFNFLKELEIRNQVEFLSKEVKTYNYEASNLKPWFELGNMEGPSYIYPHLLLTTRAYLNKEKRWQSVFRNLDDLYGWYNHLIQNIENDAAIIAEFVRKLNLDNLNSIEKAQKVYEWVRDNIKYIAFEDGMAGYIPENAQKVFLDKYGDCKGMTNLLVQLLRAVGLDARYAWLGTNYLNYDYSIPSLAVDNHMIAVLIINNDTLFLDATEKYSCFNQPTTLIEGQQVMIEDGSSYTIANIPKSLPKSNSTNVEIQYSGINSLELESTLKLELFGEAKGRFEKLNNSNEDLKSKLPYPLFEENIFNKIDLINESIKDSIYSAEFIGEFSNISSQFNNETYFRINPLDNPFERIIDVKRSVNFVFDFVENHNLKVSWLLPKGYQVKHLPKGTKFSNEYLEVDISFTSDKNMIYFHKKIILLQKSIQPNAFPDWNKAIKAIKNLEEDRIIIEKH